MPNTTLAINKCAWLYQSSSKVCNKNSVGEYCAYHKYLLKSSTGPQLCIGGCGKGIRGKYRICPDVVVILIDHSSNTVKERIVQSPLPKNSLNPEVLALPTNHHQIIQHLTSSSPIYNLNNNIFAL